MDPIRRVTLRLFQSAPDISLQMASFQFAPPTWQPSINAYRCEKGMRICVDLAGVDREAIDLRVEPYRVVIRGEREAPEPKDPDGRPVEMLAMEIDYGPFERSSRFIRRGRRGKSARRTEGRVSLDSFAFCLMSENQISVLQSPNESEPVRPNASNVEGPGGRMPAIPGTLSILPVRSFVIFPGTVLPLTIGRTSSIKLLDETLAAKQDHRAAYATRRKQRGAGAAGSLFGGNCGDCSETFAAIG